MSKWRILNCLTCCCCLKSSQCGRFSKQKLKQKPFYRKAQSRIRETNSFRSTYRLDKIRKEISLSETIYSHYHLNQVMNSWTRFEVCGSLQDFFVELACQQWVLDEFYSTIKHFLRCPHSKQQYQIHFEKSSGILRIEPRVTEQEARMLYSAMRPPLF